jgi:phosphate/sulfate permease|tara:strand:- start:928 stop:1890 length:963 start_codon:yes stop_codon:yes gene_type:complete
MDTVTLSGIYAIVGFLLASYSVVGNDSVQTLGTFIASNSERFKWYYLWAAATAVLLFTLWFGWATNGGDISYGRLNKIPYVEVQWYHAVAPAVLLLLTRAGIPVSTTFLVISAFASTFVLEKMLVKSMLGYALAAIAAYGIWFIIARYIDEKHDPVTERNKPYWRVAQWGTTGFLWYTWLSHDLANIAVYLPRELSVTWMLFVSFVFTSLLAWIFYEKGGKIQKIVLEKSGTRYVRSATIVDLVYASILLFFKEYNDIPMSTTWVFVGLLCGRELAIATVSKGAYKFKSVFPIVGRDFLKMMVGLGVSIGIVLCIHYVLT